MINPFKGKYGPLLIAEIGGNHEGDFEYAKKLVQHAIETKVDYVKLQIYSANGLVNPTESLDRHNHFKRFELSKDQYCYLASMIKEAGLEFTASVWETDAIKWIDPYISIYKIGSGDLTAYPILKKTAVLGKPIILSTGLSIEEEVLASIEYIQSVNPIYNNKNMLGVLQCTSMYPICTGDANLRVMDRLRALTNLTIGYSDHTEGLKALYYAVARGAEILEFHFTDTREGKQFRDHKVSLTKNEVSLLIDEIGLINSYLGNPAKEPLAIELDNGHDISFRRAVYPARDILAGEILTEENLTILRPNHGIDAREFDKLIGKKVNCSLKKSQKLDWSCIE